MLLLEHVKSQENVVKCKKPKMVARCVRDLILSKVLAMKEIVRKKDLSRWVKLFHYPAMSASGLKFSVFSALNIEIPLKFLKLRYPKVTEVDFDQVLLIKTPFLIK